MCRLPSEVLGQHTQLQLPQPFDATRDASTLSYKCVLCSLPFRCSIALCFPDSAGRQAVTLGLCDVSYTWATDVLGSSFSPTVGVGGVRRPRVAAAACTRFATS